jgi:hypothetical protein
MDRADGQHAPWQTVRGVLLAEEPGGIQKRNPELDNPVSWCTMSLRVRQGLAVLFTHRHAYRMEHTTA